MVSNLNSNQLLPTFTFFRRFQSGRKLPLSFHRLCHNRRFRKESVDDLPKIEDLHNYMKK